MAGIVSKLRGRRPVPDITGMTVAITGAARGIGFETAKTLTERGARVVIGDIDAEALGKASADLGHDGYELDVTAPESFNAFLDAAEAQVGPLDVLINNAGIMPTGPLLSYDVAILKRVLDIDVLGVYIGTQEAVRRMTARGQGQVINIASVAGRLPVPGLTIYDGAKAAVIVFSEACDREFRGQGVRVKTVNPTFTKTTLISGIETNKATAPIEPREVAEEIINSIVGQTTHLTVPRSMAWVHGNALMPPSVKNAAAKMTDMDRIFMHYDEAARADYLARLRGETRPGGQ